MSSDGEQTTKVGTGIRTHLEQIEGYDTRGRMVSRHAFGISTRLMEIGDVDVGRHRARMLTDCVREYAMSRVVHPASPAVVKWCLQTPNGKEVLTDLVERAGGSFDFIRFSHVPVAKPSRWRFWR
jgi:hypothetical protein